MSLALPSSCCCVVAPVGQSQKYPLRLNGTIGEGGTRQTIDDARLLVLAPGHHHHISQRLRREVPRLRRGLLGLYD
jgi:hypothetical protein